MQFAKLIISNLTQTVAEEQVITLGTAVDDEIYGAAFGFASASITASGHTPTTLATALAAQINAVAGSIVTASPSANQITVVADRAGVPIDMSVFGPSASKVVTVKAAVERDIDLSSIGFVSVPAGGSTTETLNLSNLTKATKSTLLARQNAGEISIKPSLLAIETNVISGDLAVSGGEEIELTGMRVIGDVTVAAAGSTLLATDCPLEGDIAVSAGGSCTLTGGRVSGNVTVDATSTLLAADCFFEGNITVIAGGTCTLTGGNVIGVKTGTITHSLGDLGI